LGTRTAETGKNADYKLEEQEEGTGGTGEKVLKTVGDFHPKLPGRESRQDNHDLKKGIRQQRKGNGREVKRKERGRRR